MGNGFARLGGLPESKMLATFLDYDKDLSGHVDETELLCMMIDLKLGSKETDPRWQAKENMHFLEKHLLESDADANNDGKLNFDEFKVFCRAAKAEQKAEKKAKKIKKKKKKKKKGVIAPEEVPHKGETPEQKAERGKKEKRAAEKAEQAAALAEASLAKKKQLKELKKGMSFEARASYNRHINKSDSIANESRESYDKKMNRSSSSADAPLPPIVAAPE